ncbi:MAG: carboxypeptidase-like regulatory domain-containing protein [Planctomycetia bacterium]|nr:carboxypeptidase-like regulatory domain-containing protein [Planctomycetia bacterium]
MAQHKIDIRVGKLLCLQVLGIFPDFSKRLKIMKTPHLICLVLALFVVATIGCNKSGLSGLVPVQGTVYYNDEPLAGASISFIPTGTNAETRSGNGISDQNGHFVLMTLNPEDGVYPGEYVVTVIKVKRPDVEGKTLSELVNQPRETIPQYLVPEKYTDKEQSDLRFTISSKGEKELRIDLKD